MCFFSKHTNIDNALESSIKNYQNKEKQSQTENTETLFDPPPKNEQEVSKDFDCVGATEMLSSFSENAKKTITSDNFADVKLLKKIQAATLYAQVYIVDGLIEVEDIQTLYKNAYQKTKLTNLQLCLFEKLENNKKAFDGFVILNESLTILEKIIEIHVQVNLVKTHKE